MHTYGSVILAQYTSIKINPEIDSKCSRDQLQISIFDDGNFKDMPSISRGRLNSKILESLGKGQVREIDLKLSSKKTAVSYKDKTNIYIDKPTIWQDQMITVEGDLTFIIRNNATLNFKNVIINGLPLAVFPYWRTQYYCKFVNESVIFEDSKLNVAKLSASELAAPKLPLQPLCGYQFY